MSKMEEFIYAYIDEGGYGCFSLTQHAGSVEYRRSNIADADMAMTDDEIIAMMLENDKMKAALCEIANFVASWRSGYIDEWEEAAAFAECKDETK